ncbi:MAG: MJ1255/VC2487 family glycosyltransferase [Pseudohongiellaceae bacterium]|jgi:uncharacterized protein (TIGR00661 family)
MKILYGVQGTGNGHISRASAMAEKLRAFPELDITWLLSGRERSKGCGGIERFEWREGLTFVTRNGGIHVLDTLRKNSLRRFLRDVRELDLRGYDLVISDYEPVISHAARRKRIPVTGIGHQYAFCHRIPTRGENPIVKTIMQLFAPADTAIGLHWHHFGNPILPPIIDMVIPAELPPVVGNKVIVYLPFENPRAVMDLLDRFRQFEFYVYHPELQDADVDHRHARAISRLGFKQDLLDAEAVLCNSGFELISECLCLGKRILVKPVFGQMEQLSNAAALSELGYASVMDRIDENAINRWLTRPGDTLRICYPDVAGTLAEWIAGGCRATPEQLAKGLWDQTVILR